MNLQGEVQFLTGSYSLRTLHYMQSRFGAIPKPTVIVRTEEEKHVICFSAPAFFAGVFVCRFLLKG